MTGWRIGFAVGNPDALKALNTLKGNVDSKQFAAIALTAGWALNHARNDASLELLKRRRDILVDGLNRLGWNLEKPQGLVLRLGPRPARPHVGDVRQGTAGKRERPGHPRPRLRPARRRLRPDVPDRQRRQKRRTAGRSRPPHREAHPSALVNTTRRHHAAPDTRHIDAQIADRHLLTHPFYRAWQQGELTPRGTVGLRRPVLPSCRGLSDVPLGPAQPHAYPP